MALLRRTLPLVMCVLPAAIPAQPAPQFRNPLFLSIPERDDQFRHMENERPYAKIAAAASTVRPVHKFGKGKPLELPDLDNHLSSQRIAGLIIIHNNKIRLEKYGLSFDPNSRWTSFSVAKSFTSTLVGAAIRDGHIKSLNDKVTTYIKDLKGSAYDDVTVRQLLTMTSGVKWNEDYTDPKSDVAVFLSQPPDPGVNATVSYMRKLPREAAPGTKWVYKTGETNLIGILVSEAVKKPLSDYLSEKIWKPYGMEADAYWLLDSTKQEISGCCISARLRDYARFGQFILDNDGTGSILPKEWLNQATTKQADIGTPGRGYGYQWWTEDDGTFMAVGIFGQSIFLDRKRKLVIVTNGNWPTATDRKVLQPARTAFFRRVQVAIDDERR
jgi:CubicO group peptidase (beta-lactamase class C family)